jgi:hypothetical protein
MAGPAQRITSAGDEAWGNSKRLGKAFVKQNARKLADAANAKQDLV